MVIERKPFTPGRLEEERAKDKRRVFSLSVNREEDEELLAMRALLDTKSDGVALKTFARVGFRMLHGTLGDGLMRYLFKKDRARLSDYEDLDRIIVMRKDGSS